MARWFLRNDRTRALASTIIFTDEKLFKNKSESNTEYVNRLPNTAYQVQHMKFDKSGSSTADLNVFGYIGPFGKGTHSFSVKTFSEKIFQLESSLAI